MPKGVYKRTEYHRKINSEAQKGKKISKETRKKMSESNPKLWLGKKLSKKVREKMSISSQRPERIEQSIKNLPDNRKSEQEKKEGRREYNKRRRLNPKYRLDRNMGNIMWYSLKGNKAGRKWEDLVGYTLQDLIQHLESKFKSWMTWDNYGLWHIDHIKPRSLFNYKTIENPEFKKCWALSNLQPLEKYENLRKSNKYSEMFHKQDWRI